ncbi:metal-dependent hydrolase [Phormidium tenue FACHB-886]|nr:metal-dependent hydrolase [Phormidium tenue FACHB-886]
MNTPSHFLMTAAIDKAFPRVPIVKSAFLLGSVAPDLPLWLLSIGGAIYYHLLLGWSRAETARMMFDQLYFHHPLWIVSHNFLHSPVMLLSGLALVWRSRRNIGSVQQWLFWFFVACGFHSLVDIFTHVDDGPLLLFPLNWTMRFHSPVSYWDDRYYGNEFQRFEISLNLILLVYLLSAPVRRLLRRIG